MSVTAVDLEGLHDIVVPEPVAWVPLTYGWGLLLIALLGAGLVLVWRRRRSRRANRYRVAALAELDTLAAQIRHGDTRAQALTEIPALLKRTALAAAPREAVASLTGEAWLAFLDEHSTGAAFREGAGRRVTELAHLPGAQLAAIPEAEVEVMLGEVRAWIRGHDARA